MDYLVWVAENADKVGFAALALMVIGALSWAVKFLYQEKQAADDIRIQTTVDIGELKHDVGVMKTKVEIQEERNREHVEHLKDLNRNILEMVHKATS